MNDIKFNCPQCGQHLAVDATGAGVTVACPKCGQAIIVPSAPALRASVTPKSAAKTKWWLWSLLGGTAAAVAMVAVWFLVIRQPGAAQPGQVTKQESSAQPRAPGPKSGSAFQSPGAEIPSAQPYKKIVTFQTKEPAPAQFDAWEFVWSLGKVDFNTKLDYVVLQPDGGEYFHYNFGNNYSERSDFKKGVPAGAGDPSVFFNQNIAIVFSVDKGEQLFAPGMKPSFGFFQATNGEIAWRSPFKKIDAIMTSKSNAEGAAVTFQTKEKAPPQFDAWTFYWNFPTLAPDAKLHYVVLQPDGKEYCRYELEQPSLNGRKMRSDFQPGFAGGDPAVFFNQQIRFVIQARDGDFSFPPEPKFVFHFFKKDERGKINWRAPFASIDPVMSSEKSASAAVSPDDLKRGLVLHFDFDKAPVVGKVPDLSGQGNDGEAVNVQWVADGHRGGSVAFGPTNNYIRVSNSDSLNSSNITLAVWIKTDNHGNTARRIFDKGYSDGYAMSIGGYSKPAPAQDRSFVEIGMKINDNKGCTGSEKPVTDGRWHHLAATYNGTETFFYVDGMPQKQWGGHWEGKVPANSHDLTLGQNRSTPNADFGEVGASFNGMMDDAMVFNRALSAEEIRALYDSQKTAADVVSSPLSGSKSNSTAAERLKQVKALYDQGLISKEDYDKKAKEILDSK